MKVLTPAEKVKAYIQLRDHKKQAQEAFELSMKRVYDAMNKLEAELLNDLNMNGANSIASDDGTVYKRIELSATVENREAFRDYVVENNVWEAMDIKANKTFVREYLDQHTGQPLPGVKVTQIATVGVRRS